MAIASSYHTTVIPMLITNLTTVADESTATPNH